MSEKIGVDEWVQTNVERIVNGIMCYLNKNSYHHKACGECDFRCAKWRGYDVESQVKAVRDVLDQWEKQKKAV